MQYNSQENNSKKSHASFEDELLGCAAPRLTPSQDSPKTDEQKKRTRLIQALVVSVILNVALFCVCAYESQEMGYLILRKSAYKPIPDVLSHLQSKSSIELQDALLSFNQKSNDELLCLLRDNSFVADGYTKRDLALGVLFTKRHFNMAKALGQDAGHLQERTLTLKDELGTIGEIKLFPGMREDQYDLLCHFTESERYPFTAEGLFLQIKEQKSQMPQLVQEGVDSLDVPAYITDAELKTRFTGLVDAFSLTPQYLVIEPLFSKCEITKQEIIDCITSGNWKMLEDFAQEMQKAQNFTPEKRREVLFSYIGIGSEKAAELLVKVDRDFALHHLVDAQTCQVLLLLEKKPELAKEFALELLLSPRSDEVWKCAQVQLAKVTGQEAIAGFTRAEVLAHFGKSAPEEVKKEVPENDEKTASVKAPLAKQEIKAPTGVQKTVPPKPSIKTVQPTKKMPSKVEVKSPTQLKGKEVTISGRGKPGILPKKKQAKAEMVYIVQSGDNLWRIAKKFRVDVGVLRKINNLKNDEVKPGLALRIPLS